MALLFFAGIREQTMKSSDEHPGEQRQIDDPRPDAERRVADAAQSDVKPTRFVDPYDMRADAQPEEPGYGHGV
jgi:hypothetical protein